MLRGPGRVQGAQLSYCLEREIPHSPVQSSVKGCGHKYTIDPHTDRPSQPQRILVLHNKLVIMSLGRFIL